jgi:hypothetical protein
MGITLNHYIDGRKSLVSKLTNMNYNTSGALKCLLKSIPNLNDKFGLKNTPGTFR